jgi:hypothetical protein
VLLEGATDGTGGDGIVGGRLSGVVLFRTVDRFEVDGLFANAGGMTKPVGLKNVAISCSCLRLRKQTRIVTITPRTTKTPTIPPIMAPISLLYIML